MKIKKGKNGSYDVIDNEGNLATSCESLALAKQWVKYESSIYYDLKNSPTLADLQAAGKFKNLTEI